LFRFKRSISIILVCSVLIVTNGCSNSEKNAQLINGNPVSEVGVDWPTDMSMSEMLYIRSATLYDEYQRDRGLEALKEFDASTVSVELIRFTTAYEYDQVIVDCLATKGQPWYEVDPTGGVILSRNPPNDSTTYDNMRAWYECESMYSLDPRTSGDIPRVRIEQLYHYFVDEVVECVERLGYTTDPPPTLEKFVNDYYFTYTFWSPFDRLNNNVSDLKLAQTECPYWPKDFRPDSVPSP
jgi:hypothetical protein